METYTDHSLFEDVRQYYDENGIEWRQEIMGETVHFYAHEDFAYMLQGSVFIKNSNHRKNLIYCHNLFLDEEDIREIND